MTNRLPPTTRATHAAKNGHGTEPEAEHFAAREVQGIWRLLRGHQFPRAQTPREQRIRHASIMLGMAVLAALLAAALVVGCEVRDGMIAHNTRHALETR